MKRLYLAATALGSFWLAAQGPPPGRGPNQLRVTPETVYFVKGGSETTLTQSVQVRVTGPGNPALSVTTSVAAISGGNWLTAGALSGDTLPLTATPGALGPGMYQSRLTVTATGLGLTAVVNAYLVIPGGAPAGGPGGPGGPPQGLFVRPSSLTFRMNEGGLNPEPRSLNVQPGPSTGPAWTATRTITSPPGGTWFDITTNLAAGLINVTVNGAGLTAGQYAGKITVTQGANSVDVPVNLEVRSAGGRPASRLVIAPRAFNFIAHPGGTPPGPKFLDVKATGGGTLNWTASKTGAWLNISPVSGSAPGKIELTINLTGLDPGSYEGEVEVTSGGATEKARVWLRIVGAPRSGAPALTRSTNSGVQVTPRMIEFSSTGGTVSPASVPLQLNSAVTGLTFSATKSGSQGTGWFNLTSSSGPIPATIGVSANASGLANGVYTGVIVINITGGVTEQRLVVVILRVGTTGELPRLSVRPGAVVFRGAPGGPNPAAAEVSLEARGAVSINYQAGAYTGSGPAWLTATPATGSAPRTVNIGVNLTGLTAGVYTGTVLFTATGGAGALPATLTVLLVVGAPPAPAADSGVVEADAPAYGLFLDPAAGFVATANASAPVRVLLLRSDGTALEGAQVSVASSGSEPAFGLDEVGGGVYVGAFRSLTGGPVALTATATTSAGASLQFGVGGDLQAAPQAIPVIFQDGIVGAADYAASTPVSPGSILSLFGQGLADTTQVAGSTPLPVQLGGVKVLVGGYEAPLISVSAGPEFDQINFQLPVEAGGLTYADVVVANNGAYSDPEGVTIYPVVPAIFTLSQQGAGAAAALHPDFSLVSAARPAQAGETLQIYATGIGEVRPTARTGAPPSSLATVTAAVQASMGGRPAEVTFAGLAPGFVGLYQVNVTVPAGLAAGDAPLVLSQGGIPSADGVTVAVR